MFGSKSSDVINENDPYGQYRPLELLAFRIYRRSSFYFASDNIWWGFFAAIICYIITLIMADYTADKFQGFYDKMEGISIPQPFCAGFVPFAVVINKALDKIPGFDKLNIDAEGMKKKFGLLGEPLFLGILVGCGIGALSCKNGQELVDKIPYILGLGIKMGAVMELIPRITALFIEGLKPISDATRELIAKKFKGAVGLNIGMSPHWLSAILQRWWFPCC